MLACNASLPWHWHMIGHSMLPNTYYLDLTNPILMHSLILFPSLPSLTLLITFMCFRSPPLLVLEDCGRKCYDKNAREGHSDPDGQQTEAELL